MLCLHECMILRFLRTGIRDSCGLSCGCWELKPGPLEQAVFLTAEPQRSERKPYLRVNRFSKIYLYIFLEFFLCGV